ncbi:MAG: crotonase/enoyl-CoA hydratase family protein [Congregibacter sp.]
MQYDNHDGIVTITIDDGKANVVSHAFIDDLYAALENAEQTPAKAVILRGKAGLFSAGFDLREFEKGPAEGAALALRGFQLLTRLYSFPLPLIAACTGHGIAMGAFIIMACDLRIAVRGDFKMSLPETAISMDMPAVPLAIVKSCIAPQHLTRVALLSQVYNPEQALEAGFIDELVDVDTLSERCLEAAVKMGQLPPTQFAKNKLIVREDALTSMRASLAEESGD